MRRTSRLTGQSVLRLVSCLSVLIGVALGWVYPEEAAARSVAWRNYDVTLTLNEDATFHIVERQVVDFEGGPFSYAFAEIPLARVDDITNVQVSEERGGRIIEYDSSRSNDAETFALERDSQALTITWYMPRTSDEQRTFLLEYDVVGGLRVYETPDGQRQQIWWTAIDREVSELAPIAAASFAIELPRTVKPGDLVIDGPGSADPAEHTADNRIFTWSRENMADGDALEARIEFPALVSATAPAWQQADDEQRLREQDRDSRDALLQIMLAGAGLLALTAGSVGLYGVWYLRGRDPGVGAVASYLSEPPDDLPPGAAGALVDEVVNERDIVATLVDLGKRGALNITETSEGSVFKRRDYTIALKDNSIELRPFEREFINAILGGTEPGAMVKLGDAKERFGRKVESIRNKMYEELVTRGYFPVSPESTRSRYRGIARTGLIIGAILLAVVGGRLIGISGWIILPFAALALILLALYQVARFMPRKTLAGAESAAKWRAFKQYLADLDENRATEGSNELFEKYLPYAVAFGLEHSWVSTFAEAGAPAPEWYGGSDGGGWFDPEPRRYPRRRSSWGGWVVPSGGGGTDRPGGGSFDLPDIPGPQEASDRGAKSLQSLSGGLFNLFDVAGSVFEAFGSGGGRHGGFSGGGRSFGGGGFGGGRSGGGGGGGRGFG
jgi:hypothetical protein